jgi:hypothetical protein
MAETNQPAAGYARQAEDPQRPPADPQPLPLAERARWTSPMDAAPTKEITFQDWASF